MITTLRAIEQEIEFLVALPAGRIIRTILWRWVAQERQPAHGRRREGQEVRCRSGILVIGCPEAFPTGSQLQQGPMRQH